MINPQYPLTLEQINNRLLTIITKLVKNDNVSSVKVKYSKTDTIVTLQGNIYCISDERDLVRFREVSKELTK